MFNRTKIVYKASAWSRHGKHKGMLIVCIQRNRESQQRAKAMAGGLKFESVAEMFLYYARRK